MEKQSHSPLETKQIAAQFAKSLKGGDIVVLKGDLGSGKTTFTQGLAEAFGITRPVTSPTFVGMQLYEIMNNHSAKIFCHIDAYRFGSKADAISAGLEDYLGKNDVIAVIEWPEQLFGKLPNSHKTINFTHVDESSRLINIEE